MLSGSPESSDDSRLVSWEFVHHDTSIRRVDNQIISVSTETGPLPTYWGWAVSEPTVPVQLRSGIPPLHNMAKGAFGNDLSCLWIFCEISFLVSDILASDFGCLLRVHHTRL